MVLDFNLTARLLQPSIVAVRFKGSIIATQSAPPDVPMLRAKSGRSNGWTAL